MRSNWDETRAKSKYHFNNDIMDPKWDAAMVLGKIKNTWQNDIDEIISNSRPATWADRGYKGEGVQIPSDDLMAEEYDLTKVGINPKMVINHLNWNIPKSLQTISDLIGLDQCMNRIHVQMPGDVWNLHIDKLQKWNPSDPSRVTRLFIQLTDWQPGQFWEFGNYHWNHWKAGEVVTFDWENIPHSTANAGYHPRVTFQLTGIITEKTNAFLSTLLNPSSR